MSKDILEGEYRSISSNACDFSEELARQISELLKHYEVSLAVPVERRVKTWESIEEKLERKSLQLDGIKSLHDLIGLTLILLFRRDVETVSSILSSNFTVITKENTSDRLGESQFGYGSIHFVIELPSSWLAVPTMSQLSGLRAEVQVRTASQHIWAAASHLLQYKQEAGVPSPLKRAIHRVSALLETVDLEFERVLQQRETYKDSSDIDSLSERLNVDSLAKVLDDLLPPENKLDTNKLDTRNEPYADLLLNLQDVSIFTRNQLADLIKKHLDHVISEDRNLVISTRPHFAPSRWKFTPSGGPDVAAAYFAKGKERKHRNERGVYFSHAGMVRQMLDKEFGGVWRDALAERLASAK